MILLLSAFDISIVIYFLWLFLWLLTRLFFLNSDFYLTHMNSVRHIVSTSMPKGNSNPNFYWKPTTLTHFNQCSTSIPPEKLRNRRFSDVFRGYSYVFRGYRSGTLLESGLKPSKSRVLNGSFNQIPEKNRRVNVTFELNYTRFQWPHNNKTPLRYQNGNIATTVNANSLQSVTEVFY